MQGISMELDDDTTRRILKMHRPHSFPALRHAKPVTILPLLSHENAMPLDGHGKPHVVIRMYALS